MKDREFDVILWGATGFAGKLTAEVLVDRYADTLRFALGGRNEEKLNALRDELGTDCSIVLGDALNADSMDALARRATTIATTVGPFAKYGKELVAACARHGTHYCDLTGEVDFAREMIDEHHDRARETGARIVHFAGFDSVPSDIGAFELQRIAMEKFGEPVERIRSYLIAGKGGASGGTLATMMNTAERARRDRELRRVLANPYALNPEGEQSGPDGRDSMAIEYDEDIDAWIGPFFMASVNTRVVRRTNALLDFAWGRDFSYTEVTRYGDGLKGRAKAMAATVAMGALFAGVAFPPTQKILGAVLPDPGEGPSEQAIEEGFFLMRHRGCVEGEELKVEVKGRRDPGYGATASMFAAVAACLALDADELPSDGGVLTPAAAMGSYLVDRLNADGEVTVREAV